MIHPPSDAFAIYGEHPLTKDDMLEMGPNMVNRSFNKVEADSPIRSLIASFLNSEVRLPQVVPLVPADVP